MDLLMTENDKNSRQNIASWKPNVSDRRSLPAGATSLEGPCRLA